MNTDLKVELRTEVRAKETNWQLWMVFDYLCLCQSLLWLSESEQGSCFLPDPGKCISALKGHLWDKGIRSFSLLSSCLYCDVRWYSGLQNGFRLLPLSPLLPFGSIQTQALSKLAVQRCKSLMKTDTSKSSSLTSNNPPTLFWSVQFGFSVIAKRSCKIFSYISIFIIYACGSLFICFIASCLSSVFMVEVHMTPNWYNAIRFCEGFFFSRSYIQTLAFI